MLVKNYRSLKELNASNIRVSAVSEQNSSILLYDTDREDGGNSSSKMLLTIYHSTWSQIPKQSSLI